MNDCFSSYSLTSNLSQSHNFVQLVQVIHGILFNFSFFIFIIITLQWQQFSYLFNWTIINTHFGVILRYKTIHITCLLNIFTFTFCPWIYCTNKQNYISQSTSNKTFLYVPQDLCLSMMHVTAVILHKFDSTLYQRIVISSALSSAEVRLLVSIINDTPMVKFKLWVNVLPFFGFPCNIPSSNMDFQGHKIIVRSCTHICHLN